VIEELIQEIAQGLDKEKILYMIIGGQAVLLYGTPRLTRYIDITLGVDTDQFPRIESMCRELGLKVLPENPEEFARETRVLPAEELESRIRVDFIFSFTPYEAQAIKRAKQVLMGDYPVKFASCEDVIIHKMIAARAIDVEDVKNILIKAENSADLEYIKGWLSEFAKIPEHKGILERFNSLSRQR
jgi:hypothetical protein